MTGSSTKVHSVPTSREAILKAMEKPPPGGYYVWDDADEDDRPATQAELHAGQVELRRARGRPPGSAKESTTIRFDHDVLDAFRAGGPGWQSRMNAALRDWLKSHKAA